MTRNNDGIADGEDGDDGDESKADSVKTSSQSCSGEGRGPAQSERTTSSKASRRLALMERMLAVDGLYYPLRNAACNAFCACYGGGRSTGGRRAAEQPKDASDAVMKCKPLQCNFNVHRREAMKSKHLAIR